jgi:hypothetical protein
MIFKFFFQTLTPFCAFLALAMQVAFAAAPEMPLEAVLGNKKQFIEWRNQFSDWYLGKMNQQNFLPRSHEILKTEEFDDLTLLTVRFLYPMDSPLSSTPIQGGVLAVPKKLHNKSPIVVAIHGHEELPWGYPMQLFKDRKWPFNIAKDGYVVWAPVTMQHNEIEAVANNSGFPLIWTKIISDGLDYGATNIWPSNSKDYIAAGLSAGGQIAYLLMAYRQDVKVGVFAGAAQNLDYLRREYRINDHPNCWDIDGINSFTQIQALIAPRPIQIQLGMLDPFAPLSNSLLVNDHRVKGVSRGVYSWEIGADALIIRSAYEIYGVRNNFSYFIHDGGHEFNVKNALKFINKYADP